MDKPKFKIHVNRELKDRAGRPMKFYSERDYRNELQKRGLEQYDESKYKRYEPKKYAGVSENAKRMMESVSYDKKTGRPNVGDRYYDELKRMGMKSTPKEIMDKQRGGFYGR